MLTPERGRSVTPLVLPRSGTVIAAAEAAGRYRRAPYGGLAARAGGRTPAVSARPARRASAAVGALLFLASAALGACTIQRSSSVAPTTLPPASTSISLGGRSYLLHRRPSGPTPALVVVLHGASLTAAQTERYYQWDALADTQGFAVAYPQGIDDAWNAGSCCGSAPSRGTDDVSFVNAVITDAMARSGTDPARVYLTGVSNGAMMTLRYECAYPGRVAAIGSVAGTFTSPCDHPPAVPFIAIHGLNDHAVYFNAGPGTEESGPSIRLPARETIDRMEAADGCRAPHVTTTGPVHDEVPTCTAPVEVITIDGAGHQWPGAVIDAERLAEDGPDNQPSTAIDATA